MLVTPNYHFNGDCREALTLYERAFPARLTVLMLYRDADPSDMRIACLSDREKSLVYHAEMVIGSQRFMFSDSIQEVTNGQNISIVVTFDSADDVKAAHSVLADGASVVHPMQETTYSSCFVSLVDKFGMRWELMTENNA